MKLKISFSQNPTKKLLSWDLVNINPKTITGMTYSLTFNLTKNCNTTDKFIDLCKQTFKSGLFRCSYTFTRDNAIRETHFKLKREMNAIIERVNASDELPDIDISLMLDTSSITPDGNVISENSKLNALHLYFEKHLSLNISEYWKRELEDINHLVHTLEGGFIMPVGTEVEQITYASLRLLPENGNGITMPLTDEDYDNFTIHNNWGDLLLDYFTVGKDLYAAATTNDVPLIVNKELSQQSTVHPCVSLKMNVGQEITESDIDKVYEWCDKNNVRDYYDIDLPMYNFGRVVLGKIDMSDITKNEISTELSKCTGITNVELIDE